MGSDDESKLAAPKLFGRKRRGSTPPVAEPARHAEPTAPAEPADETTEPARETEPTAVLEPVPAAEPALETRRQSAQEAATATTAPQSMKEEPAKEPKTPRAPKTPKPARMEPILTGMQAAAFTGLLVGAFLVLATYGSLNLCSAVRGASTCGGSAGFPLLLVIGVIAVVGGGTLLRIFRVPSPMGDSFLSVALVSVLTVLFLHNHYDAWWMIIAVPVLTILAFLLAHWVSVTYIEPMDG